MLVAYPSLLLTIMLLTAQFVTSECRSVWRCLTLAELKGLHTQRLSVTKLHCQLLG